MITSPAYTVPPLMRSRISPDGAAALTCPVTKVAVPALSAASAGAAQVPRQSASIRVFRLFIILSSMADAAGAAVVRDRPRCLPSAADVAAAASGLAEVLLVGLIAQAGVGAAAGAGVDLARRHHGIVGGGDEDLQGG